MSGRENHATMRPTAYHEHQEPLSDSPSSHEPAPSVPARYHERANTGGQIGAPIEHEPEARSGEPDQPPQRGKTTATTVGTKAREHITPKGGPAARQVGTLPPNAAPNGAGAAGGDAAARLQTSDPLPVLAGMQPHLAEAVRAAAAARAVAARVRAAVAGGSVPVVAEQPGSAAAVDGSRRRGLSVAEAAAAATISFRPLRRPFGRLPHGAPQSDVKSREAGAIAGDAPRPEPPGASAPSEAGVPRPVARTIAELERLRRAAGLQVEQPQLLLMSPRA